MILPAECAGLDVLGELEPTRLVNVLEHRRIATFSAGDTILQRGAGNDQLHLILSGVVHVHFEIDNRSQPIEIGAGSLFGEMSVLEELPVSAFVTAAEPCGILLLPASVFWSDVVTVSGIAHTVMRGLSARLRHESTTLMQGMRNHIRRAALVR